MQSSLKKPIRILLIASTIIVIFTSNLSAQMPTQGLIGYYPLNGNGLDVSGYNNNGTVIGTLPTKDRFARDNYAMFFNGVDDQVQLPDVFRLSSLTICGWICPNNVDQYEKEAFTIYQDADNYFQIFQTMSVNNLAIQMRYNRDVPWELTATNSSLPLNQWTFCTVVIDSAGGKVSLYINGEFSQQVDLNGVYLSNFSGAMVTSIGGGSKNSTDYFSGNLNDFRIFNRALSASEINTLYHEGRWDPIASGSIAGSLEDITFDSTTGDSTAIPLSSGSSINLFRGTQSVGAVSPSSNGTFLFSGLDSLQTYSITIDASETLVPTNRFFSLALSKTSISTGTNTYFNIPISLFGSSYLMADTLLASPTLNSSILLGWVPLSRSLFQGYDVSGVSNLLSSWTSVTDNYDQISSSLIHLNIAEWQIGNYCQDASLMTMETLQSLYPFAQRIFGLAGIGEKIEEYSKDKLELILGDDIINYALDGINVALNLIFSRIPPPEGVRYQAACDQLMQTTEAAGKSGKDLLTDEAFEAFYIPIGANLFLSYVYVPGTQHTFDWAIQQSKSYNFTGSYSSSYSTSSSLYNSSHVSTLTAQSAGIGLRATSDFFDTGSEMLAIGALITAPGAPLAAALSTLSTVMGVASLVTVTGAVVVDGVRLVNIPIDLSKTISSIYGSSMKKTSRLSKTVALGKMSGLSGLANNLHKSSTSYNDALNILITDVKADNRQNVRLDIETLLNLDSVLNRQLRITNLSLQAVASLGDSTMVQFDSLYSQHIDNFFTSSNTKQSTYLNLLAYLIDSLNVSYVDSIKKYATAAIKANNRVDSLSNELLASVQNTPIPGYVASVSTSAPTNVSVNSVFTIKTRFQNFGGTLASNLYAKISLLGGFSTGIDSVSVGSLSPSGQDSVQFVVTAPTTDTVGVYSIIFIGDNTSSEPVGGVIVATNLISVGNIVQTIPRSFNLYQSYPNPFNPATTISYDLPQKEHVTLVIYDILGRQVETIVDNIQQPGKYKVTFNGSNLSSGVYFCRLQAGLFAETKKLILLK